MLQRWNTSPYQKGRNVTCHFVPIEIFYSKNLKKNAQKQWSDLVTCSMQTGRKEESERSYGSRLPVMGSVTTAGLTGELNWKICLPGYLEDFLLLTPLYALNFMLCHCDEMRNRRVKN